jgi:branched-chain amino acid transport system substrate-binding protein
MKVFILLSLSFVFLLSVLLNAEASDHIRIGLTLGMTGKYSEMSNMQMKGFRLWESDVNSRGSILGRNVHVIIYDDKSDPQNA